MPSDNTDVTLHSRLQAIFINRDEEIRDPATKQWAKARNSNIIEDLGRTSYVFSDKTGTLTSNEMRLRGIAVKQKAYGTMDFRWVVPATCRLSAADLTDLELPACGQRDGGGGQRDGGGGQRDGGGPCRHSHDGGCHAVRYQAICGPTSQVKPN